MVTSHKVATQIVSIVNQMYEQQLVCEC